MIRFNCQCGKEYKAQEALAGRSMKCKVCSRTTTIPSFIPDELLISLDRPRWLSIAYVLAGILVGAIVLSLIKRYFGDEEPFPVPDQAQNQNAQPQFFVPVPPEPLKPANEAAAPRKEPDMRKEMPRGGFAGNRFSGRQNIPPKANQDPQFPKFEIPLDPCQKIAVDYLKKHAEDPEFFEVMDIRKPVTSRRISVVVDYDIGIYILIQTKTPEGLLALQPCIVCLSNNEVVYVHKTPKARDLNTLYGIPIEIAELMLGEGKIPDPKNGNAKSSIDSNLKRLRDLKRQRGR